MIYPYNIKEGNDIMGIKYNITKYFNDNNLFESNISNGLTITNELDTLLIKGSSRDLVELADILVNIAKEKEAHIHIDDLSLISNNSKYKELIIEKEISK